MRLSPPQEQILKSYAVQKHPKITKDSDYQNLCLEKYLHAGQDHITDKGCAYALVYLNVSYLKLVKTMNWQNRHAVLMNAAKRVFHSNEELEIYFKEKYKLNLKYDTWQSGGGELQADSTILKKIGAEICVALLENPKIEWKKVRGWLASKDMTGTMEQISSKEYLKEVLQEQLKQLCSA